METPSVPTFLLAVPAVFAGVLSQMGSSGDVSVTTRARNWLFIVSILPLLAASAILVPPPFLGESESTWLLNGLAALAAAVAVLFVGMIPVRPPKFFRFRGHEPTHKTRLRFYRARDVLAAGVAALSVAVFLGLFSFLNTPVEESEDEQAGQSR